MSFLSINNISKIYPGGVQALKQVKLEIEKGEFSVIIGPSGCGKSTLLKIIAGLEFPDTGEIILKGEVQNHLPPQKRNLAMMFQSYVLFPHMNVYQNLVFGMKMRKEPSDTIKQESSRVSEILGIKDIWSRFPHEISGGQRQRVAMGRAILKKPALYLMDEPLSNLDAKLRTQMRFELKEIQQELGATFVYVTHDQTEAMTLGDNVSLFNLGVCHQSSPPLEIYNNPADLFVADFMGNPQLNKLESDAVLLPKELEEKLKGNGATITFRPEHVSSVKNHQQVQLEISAKVKYMEHLGSHSYLHLDLKGKSLVARTETPANYNPGSQYSFYVNVNNCMGFQSEKNSRIF